MAEEAHGADDSETAAATEFFDTVDAPRPAGAGDSELTGFAVVVERDVVPAFEQREDGRV